MLLIPLQVEGQGVAVSGFVSEPVVLRFLLLCVLRDGRELFGVKLARMGTSIVSWTLDQPQHLSLVGLFSRLTAGVRHFLRSGSHSLLWELFCCSQRAELFPGLPSKPPRCFTAVTVHGQKKASAHFWSSLFFLPNFCWYLRKIVHICTCEIFT